VGAGPARRDDPNQRAVGVGARVAAALSTRAEQAVAAAPLAAARRAPTGSGTGAPRPACLLRLPPPPHAEARPARTIASRQVVWLPPIERLWHLATTGAPPDQYTHQMCELTTERHPLQGFVHTVLGVSDAA